MSKNITEQIISNIDDKYIYESINFIQRRSKTSYKAARTIGKIAACLCMIFVVSVSSLSIAAAAGNIPANDILYSLYPDLAMKLSPVNESCENNGIKMEVESIYVHGNMADIYVSMQDLTENRIDETTDLFDSYNIHTSCDQIGGCEMVNYDADTSTATFLIQIQQDAGKEITGKKMIFSVSQFLSGKREVNKELEGISLADISNVPEIQTEVNLRGYGEAGFLDDISGFLIQNDAQTFSPVDGATVTAYGFIDNKLHVQVYYENILKYDNHGEVYLKNADGNEVHCLSNITFWDENETGSYEEYIFDISPEDDFSNYSVWGYFCTGNTLTTGQWEVVFPIENKD